MRDISKNALIILCAGEGARTGLPAPKAYLPLRGMPLFAHSLNMLRRFVDEKHIIFVVSERHARFSGAIKAFAPEAHVITGGARRHLSSLKGLEYAYNIDNGLDAYLIHDACRPFPDSGTIKHMLSALDNADASFPALSCTDTVKIKAENSRLNTAASAPARETLLLAQTPQCFRGSAVKRILASKRAITETPQPFTDDISLLEFSCPEAHILPVEGSKNALKITAFADIREAVDIYDKLHDYRPPQRLCSTGYDAHAYADSEEKALKIGGVTVPADFYSKGHSDGDALLHAITDALLASVCARDIGYYFSDRDSLWKDADSAAFLRFARDIVTAHKRKAVFCDATVICQKPILHDYIFAIQRNIANLLFDSPEAMHYVALQATTTDKLGFCGRGEGLVCTAHIETVPLP